MRPLVIIGAILSFGVGQALGHGTIAAPSAHTARVTRPVLSTQAVARLATTWVSPITAPSTTVRFIFPVQSKPTAAPRAPAHPAADLHRRTHDGSHHQAHDASNHPANSWGNSGRNNGNRSRHRNGKD
jgi:hypothetical protein